MSWAKGEFLQAGKGKNLYKALKNGQDSNNALWMEFKDDLTAFNGKKHLVFVGKGACNREISSLVFRYLKKEGLANHWLEDAGPRSMVCSSLKMIPLEFVVRNYTAGSLIKKFGLKEGQPLSEPLLELYYKKDELNDPFVSLDQAAVLGLAADRQEVKRAGETALQVNQKLEPFFARAGLKLVDFKMEFGVLNGEVILGDEISCDSCRLWEQQSHRKMDKDRFRLNLGNVMESYQTVRHRIKQAWF